MNEKPCEARRQGRGAWDRLGSGYRENMAYNQCVAGIDFSMRASWPKGIAGDWAQPLVTAAGVIYGRMGNVREQPVRRGHGLCTRSAGSRVMGSIRQVLDEPERECHIARYSGGARERRQSSCAPGGPAPLGPFNLNLLSSCSANRRRHWRGTDHVVTPTQGSRRCFQRHIVADRSMLPGERKEYHGSMILVAAGKEG